MKWLLLTLGIITQVCATTCMKLSDGFSNLLPSILSFVFAGLSFTVFIFALKYFDLSYAYALWSALGILFIAMVGFAYFNEPVSTLKVVSICIIVIGVIGLNLSGFDQE